ncbi:hypothetical protein CRG98_035635 [Punica granatum]|uniref:Uncharacterized protein n=1 Tax=Punica granatum TaxID=22663 RepID=A0A2I0IIV9_PUNGR|nr:hypothetical protein CRG98_035635 [Punica granatum]
MGPQRSGGKLILFLSVMYVLGVTYWSQTTRGVWLAKADGIQPLTLVMDLEGNDGDRTSGDSSDHLEEMLRNDIQKVEVVALSSYEHMEYQFKEQVASLKQRSFHSITPGGVAGDRSSIHSWFSILFQCLANMESHQGEQGSRPAHSQEIAAEKSSTFAMNEEWSQIEEAVQSGVLAPGFGKKLAGAY